MLVYDLANCGDTEQAVSGVYNEDNYVAVYNEDNLGLLAYHGSLSSDGRELVVSTILNENELFSIVVFDLDTKEYRFIDAGFNPSFSRDGEWVAYTGITEGIYIARSDGSEKQKLVHYENPEFGGGGWFTQMDWPPKPVWSPDGNWLVYHKCELEGTERTCNRLGNYVIYKVNVHTGEEVKIIEGGLNPYWRP
jgi:Tol biopolymer transport system component